MKLCCRIYWVCSVLFILLLYFFHYLETERVQKWYMFYMLCMLSVCIMFEGPQELREHLHILNNLVGLWMNAQCMVYVYLLKSAAEWFGCGSYWWQLIPWCCDLERMRGSIHDPNAHSEWSNGKIANENASKSKRNCMRISRYRIIYMDGAYTKKEIHRDLMWMYHAQSYFIVTRRVHAILYGCGV